MRSLQPMLLLLPLLKLAKTSALSGASDVVVVKNPETNSMESTSFRVHVGKFDSWRTLIYSRENKLVQIFVNDRHVDDMRLDGDGRGCFTVPNCNLHPSSMSEYGLKYGLNKGLYVIPALEVRISFSIFVLENTAKLVISDVDGTITRDDLTGFLVPQLLDQSHNHAGVAALLTLINNRGYNTVYVTVRPSDLADVTRSYLFDHKQPLPLGPILLSPSSSLPASLIRGVARPHTLKTPVLKELLAMFNEEKGSNVVAAFGNRAEDAMAYVEAGVDPERVHIVVSKEEKVQGVNNFDNYNDLFKHIDMFFPPLNISF